MIPAIAIYLCGFPIGVYAIRRGAHRTWRDPEARRAIAPIRAAFENPAGIAAIMLAALALWPYFAMAVPMSIRKDRRWRADDTEAGAR